MCIQYVASIGYACGHYKDEPTDLITCNAVDDGEECAGVQEEPAPSAQRSSEDCPECIAVADSALETSPSTEPEGQGQTEEVTK